jgi:hypothetical protein
MYNVKGGLFASVGFRGYFGGFPAICVMSDSEFASMLEVIFLYVPAVTEVSKGSVSSSL